MWGRSCAAYRNTAYLAHGSAVGEMLNYNPPALFLYVFGGKINQGYGTAFQHDADFNECCTRASEARVVVILVTCYDWPARLTFN